MPIISLAVVINGPEAMAGFIPNLSNKSGVTVPVNEAKTTTETNEKQTTKNSWVCPAKYR